MKRDAYTTEKAAYTVANTAAFWIISNEAPSRYQGQDRWKSMWSVWNLHNIADAAKAVSQSCQNHDGSISTRRCFDSQVSLANLPDALS